MRGTILFLALVAVSSGARAQSREDVWVVPIANDAEGAVPIAEGARRTLRDAGFVVPAAEALVERFEATISQPAPELSQRQLDEWAQRSTSAVRHLARADYDAARADLAITQALAESAAEELNREAGRARQVLDTCLYLVRAFLETGDTPQAETQARECRRLVPRVDPSQFRHTPEVRELLERVDAAIAREPLGRLVVESEPSGCAVRLAGVASGQTPFTLVDLAQGTYGVQVECSPEDRGRVHRVEVRTGETRVHIDTRFESALRSRPIVHARGAEAIDALKKLSRRMDVSIVALEPTARGGWTARLIERNEVGERVELGPRGEAHEFVASLRGGDERVRTARAPTSEGRARSPRWLATGLVLAAVGIGAYGGGLATHRLRAKAGDTYVAREPVDPDFVARQRDWLDYQVPTHVLAYVGGAFVAAGFAFALPERDGTPWWAWLSGGVGLLTAGIGAALVVTFPDCEQVAETPRACVDRGQGGQRSSFLVSAALPLLAVPFTYLFGRDAPVRVEGSGSATHATLSLRGTF
ncbi:MAG: PEGA domain-containing protein [Sandaracinus sp.]|nr:PEGA domain-containing protein [Sandaracinus sp.]MCB9617561.1 PEGA domain-containing protein [Sandaracinus sp.]MCB9624844.1 PEGA domain-containing protein [Sandaracinus sp.]MCB9635359.1 PEGA domain-containing protein [Sandaracinus sp.]